MVSGKQALDTARKCRDYFASDTDNTRMNGMGTSAENAILRIANDNSRSVTIRFWPKAASRVESKTVV
jgi:hypothetical protein